MKNEYIPDFLRRYFGDKVITSAILYGSISKADIDILVILDDNLYYERIQEGLFDLTIVGHQSGHHMATHLNPIVTEPVLDGTEMIGNVLPTLKEIIKVPVHRHKVADHLLGFADSILKTIQSEEEWQNYEETITNIVFLLSYIRFAEYYNSHLYVVQFEQLLNDDVNSALYRAHKYLKSRNYSQNRLRSFVKEANYAFQEVKSLLL